MAGYFLAMHFWTFLFGTSETVLRIPSVFGVELAIVAAAALAFRLSGYLAGTVAVIVMAGSSLVSTYGWDARPYGLATGIAATAGFLAFSASRETRRRRRIIYSLGWSALGAFAISLHLFAVLVVLPQALWLSMRRKRGDTFVFLLAPAILPVAIALIDASLEHRMQTLPGLATVTLGDVETAVRNVYPTTGAVFVLIGLAGIAAVRMAGSQSRTLRSTPIVSFDALVLLIWAVLPMVALPIGSALWKPIFLDRYCIFSDPAVAVLVGVAFSSALRSIDGKNKHRLAAVIVGVAGLVAGTAAAAHTLARPWTKLDDLRSATEYLTRSASPSDEVIYTPASASALVEWYFPRIPGARPLGNLEAPERAPDTRDAYVGMQLISLPAAERQLRQLKRIWVAGIFDLGRWRAQPDMSNSLLMQLRRGWSLQRRRSFGAFIVELWT